jgi:hypothetical protein
MKFEVITTATNGRSHGGRSYASDQSTVLMTIHKAGGGKSQVALRIGKDVMKSQRWLVGDKVITQLVRLESGELALHINRSTTDGHTLSAPSEHKGKMETATIKITNDSLLNTVREFAGCSVSPLVVDGALLFILGKKQ